MSELLFQNALNLMAEEGLNIFASVPILELPSELLNGIELSKYHSIGLFANGGTRMWECLTKPVIENEHPIDTKSLKLTKEFHQRLFPNDEFLQLYPNESLVIPLQRLGRELNISRPSYLGLDINNQFGPWMAFRSVFVTTAIMPAKKPLVFESPCKTCADKPCINICPAQAIGEKFKISNCATYRLSENSKCHDRCLARLECPIGKEHQFSIEQIQYHMLRKSHLKMLGKFTK